MEDARYIGLENRIDAMISEMRLRTGLDEGIQDN
jgi:hypothetical protein